MKLGGMMRLFCVFKVKLFNEEIIIYYPNIILAARLTNCCFFMSFQGKKNLKIVRNFINWKGLYLLHFIILYYVVHLHSVLLPVQVIIAVSGWNTGWREDTTTTIIWIRRRAPGWSQRTFCKTTRSSTRRTSRWVPAQCGITFFRNFQVWIITSQPAERLCSESLVTTESKRLPPN